MTRRMDRVNVLLREEVSRVLSVELRDPRISTIVSVTHVNASPDLRYAKVFVSVLGDQSDKKSTLKGLKSAAGFIRRIILQQLSLRAAPHLEFYLDESIELGAELLERIDNVSALPEARDGT